MCVCVCVRDFLMCVHSLLVSHPWLPSSICCGGRLSHGLFTTKDRHHLVPLKATRNHIPSPNTITISKPPETTTIPVATVPQQPTATSFNPQGPLLTAQKAILIKKGNFNLREKSNLPPQIWSSAFWFSNIFEKMCNAIPKFYNVCILARPSNFLLNISVSCHIL